MFPFKLPLMLTIPRNDLPLLTAELIILTMFAIVLALPLVALPAVVLLVTSALPEVELRLTLLVIAALTELLSVILPLGAGLA